MDINVCVWLLSLSHFIQIIKISKLNKHVIYMKNELVTYQYRDKSFNNLTRNFRTFEIYYFAV